MPVYKNYFNFIFISLLFEKLSAFLSKNITIFKVIIGMKNINSKIKFLSKLNLKYYKLKNFL